MLLGAGKTGVDTAGFLAKNAPASQRVIMVQGGGLYFINRDKIVPQRHTCLGRLGFSQSTIPELFFRIVNEYDGENASQVYQSLERDGLIIRIGKGQPRYSMFGILSPAEARVIEERVELVHGDHFASCEVSSSGSKVVTLTSGATIDVAAKFVVLIKCMSSIGTDGTTRSVFHHVEHPIMADGRCGAPYEQPARRSSSS